jgi:hypothetical protein
VYRVGASPPLATADIGGSGGHETPRPCAPGTRGGRGLGRLYAGTDTRRAKRHPDATKGTELQAHYSSFSRGPQGRMAAGDLLPQGAGLRRWPWAVFFRPLGRVSRSSPRFGSPAPASSGPERPRHSGFPRDVPKRLLDLYKNS